MAIVCNLPKSYFLDDKTQESKLCVGKPIDIALQTLTRRFASGEVQLLENLGFNLDKEVEHGFNSAIKMSVAYQSIYKERLNC